MVAVSLLLLEITLVLLLVFTGEAMYVYATTPPISKTITITTKAIILLFVKTPPIKINYKLFFHVNMFCEHHD